MSTDSIGSNTSATTITNDVFARIDANGDGKLSIDEFGTFLTNLLGSRLSDGTLETPANAVASATVTSVAPTTIQPFHPIASRYVFAGFAPDNHLGETPTVNAPKYAVYNELAALANDPSFNPNDFASKAAANLQQLFGNPMWTDGQPLFRAIDGETLAYGDEYVHYAPTGYGLQAGTYNPEAPGEFFWGYTNA